MVAMGWLPLVIYKINTMSYPTLQACRFVVDSRKANDQQRQQVHRAFISDSFLRLAFQYEPDIEYYAHSKVVIGAMDKECPHCRALKFKNEPVRMCCASGKVQLPEIETPLAPLNGLFIGTDSDSNVFLKSIRTFNSCFQITSFGATEIIRNTNANGQQHNSTFKIRGQVYHKMGSLLPMLNQPHKFLQIYCMGGEGYGKPTFQSRYYDLSSNDVCYYLKSISCRYLKTLPTQICISCKYEYVQYYTHISITIWIMGVLAIYFHLLSWFKSLGALGKS
ncbi:hypothetical protein AGLY_014560, partial [Aphis glycines]